MTPARADSLRPTALGHHAGAGRRVAFALDRPNDPFDFVIGCAPIPRVRLMGGVMLRKYLGHRDRIESECLGPKAVGCLRVISRLLMKGLLGQSAGLRIGVQIA